MYNSQFEYTRWGAVFPGDSSPVLMIGADRSHFTPFTTNRLGGKQPTENALLRYYLSRHYILVEGKTALDISHQITYIMNEKFFRFSELIAKEIAICYNVTGNY